MVTTVILASISHLFVPLVYKSFFDLLTGSAGTAAATSALVGYLITAMGLYLLGWVFWRVATFSASYFENKIMVELSNTVFGYLHRHAVSFFHNTFVGSLVKKVNRFSRSFELIVDTLFFEFLPVLVDVTFIAWVLFSKNFYYGLIVVAWIIFYVLINYFFSIYKLKFDFLRSEADSKATGVLADSITNQQNIKFFNGFEREKLFFWNVNVALKKIRQISWNLGNLSEAIQGLLMIFLEIGVFYFTLKMWQQGLASIGDFVLIQAYLLTIFHRLWNFGRIIRHYYEHLAEANEMTEILEMPNEIKDAHGAKDLAVTEGKIEFKQVTFSYNQTRRVINNLNLIVSPKEKVALVGPSGAGKSTIVNLLLRNYDLEKGKILIDGQKISQVILESLWQNIALVPQDPILFHRTLMENIKYGRPKSSDEEAIRAAKQANAHDFITSFSEGYQTYVGERGVKLSGGERQRVAIARAILKNAPILVMDEATSSLDSESERLIQEALDVLMKDKTVMVIAHRLSTIMKMDRIVVLDQGRVVEEGTHQQLLKQKTGLYKKLWDRQAGGFISNV